MNDASARPATHSAALDPTSDAHARVNVAALERNYRALAALAATPVLAPVKANAYGHGAVIVARTLEAQGVAYLGVATASEALELRDGGVNAPVLLLTPPRATAIPALVHAGISFVVSSDAEIDALEREARAQHRRALAHLKLNTGLNRLGARPGDAARLLQRLERPGGPLELEGVMTHLVDSEDLEPAHAARQVEAFRAFLDEHRVSARYRHAANTGGVMNAALDAHFNLVRPGIGLYGYPPGPDLAARVTLEPVMTVRTWVSFVKRVPRGEIASYNAAWTAARDTTLATVRFGYADGYPRALTNNGAMLVRGRRLEIAGRVSMDQVLLDAGDHDVAVGDDVTVFGPGEITAETVAAWAGTNSYEILTGIGPRVPRVAVRD